MPAFKDVSETKLCADEAILRCEEAIVTARWPDSFYIESDDRAIGIRVDRMAHGLSQGMRANVSGAIRTDSNGERYIAALALARNGSGSVEPLGLTGKGVGGSGLLFDPISGAGQQGVAAFVTGATGQREAVIITGLNNIGLLVRIWGKVTWANGDSFYIDDGSGGDDGDPEVTGIRVLLPDGVDLPSVGDRVSVTGVSSCLASGGAPRRLIRVRAASDIIPL